MSNPFMKNNMFTNSQPKLDSFLGNKTQINPNNNNLNNDSKNETNNLGFNQNNVFNPFKINSEPNSNNLNNKINQNNNPQNSTNSFSLLKTQPNNTQNSFLNINTNQNNKNNIIINSNPIINNNNTNNNTSNIFNNNQFTNNPQNSNNNINIKPNNINIIPQNNKIELKKEEKKEETNIFISQSNNILNKSNNLLEKSQTNSQLNISDLPNISKIENKNSSPNLNIAPEKKEKSKVNEFINSLLSEDKLIFSEKEKKEFEKKQLFVKNNEEILNEFKNMLETQKEKYTKCVSNTRIFDRKLSNLMYNVQRSTVETLNNERIYNQLLEKIKITETKFTNLKINMTNKDKTVTDALEYLKKNLNNYNNLSAVKSKSFEEKNKFYTDLNETSEKIKKIDNNINTIWNSLNKDEENKNEFFQIDYEKERQKENDNINRNNYNIYRNNNNLIINDNLDGIIIERNELDKKKKIYVEQKDINNIFTECYDGLYGLKCMQDEFDIKYERLKNSLIKKIDESNENFGKRNIKQEDMDLQYDN